MQGFAYYQKSLAQQNSLKSPYTILKLEFIVACNTKQRALETALLSYMYFDYYLQQMRTSGFNEVNDIY